MGRIETVCSHLPRCAVLADVGCDHGYCTRYAFDNGLCERAYITDVSAPSLKKAARLMQKEIAAGRCIPVCCDGLDGVGELPDCVLIAGMGGEEIVSILARLPALPASFVLQPMKNSEKVRAFLCGRGAGITADYTFSDGKWYDLIAGCADGGTKYSAFECRYRAGGAARGGGGNAAGGALGALSRIGGHHRCDRRTFMRRWTRSRPSV